MTIQLTVCVFEEIGKKKRCGNEDYRNVLSIFVQMWEYRRLRTVVRKWIHYSGGALGLGILSGWLFRHSQLGGSNDLERWTKEGVGAARGFLEEHVQKPVFILYTN